MSLVGPRPCLDYETDQFEPQHFERFLVPAGLTGLWQVTARSRSTFREALDMDVAYVRGWSIGLDLRLLFRTPGLMMRRRGVGLTRFLVVLGLLAAIAAVAAQSVAFGLDPEAGRDGGVLDALSVAAVAAAACACFVRAARRPRRARALRVPRRRAGVRGGRRRGRGARAHHVLRR